MREHKGRLSRNEVRNFMIPFRRLQHILQVVLIPVQVRVSGCRGLRTDSGAATQDALCAVRYALLHSLLC